MHVFYLKADAKAELDHTCVMLEDVAKVLCEDDRAQKKAQSITIYEFEGGNRQGKVQREVVDVLRLIALLQSHFPGCRVESIGETATVVEFHQSVSHPVWEKVKIVLISLLCFCGAAFTIMAFHNDISIENIFAEMYRLFTGKESNGFTVLEISYSVGLSAGIILFFNHIGTRRITKDPTPIEVQMREYESNVVTALVENAQRSQGEEGRGQKESRGRGTGGSA